MKSEAVLVRELVFWGFLGIVFFSGCRDGTNQLFSGPNPTPTITTILPKSAVAGGAAFTLTINGTNFVAASMVNFGGAGPTTTFVSATQLIAAIPAAAISSAGTLAVTVTNHVPGGGTSNAATFIITSGTNPTPTINSLSPSCGPGGEQAFTLSVNGSNFGGGSVVRWNGTDRPTALASSSQLTAQISTSDIAAAGTAAVTVFNAAPGGGSSNTSTFTITTGGVGPQSIAVDQHAGKFAYVANEGCGETAFGNVSMYTINPITGALASIGPPVATYDEGARSMTVDPFGKFAYVANWGEGDTAGSVSAYTINANTGALTHTGTIDGGPSGLLAPWSVAVDPSGKFAYVPSEGGFAPTTVSMFTISATTGALTPIGTIAAGGRATSVAVDPTGKFVYVAAESDPGSAGEVSMYAIDASTGALTSMGTIGTGTDPVSVAFNSTGKFAYVTNRGSNDVSMYTINSTTGALTPIGAITAGSSPTSIATVSANFAYVTNYGSSDVSMYTINAMTGVLTPIGTTAAGLSPASIAIDPSGKFAYVTNSGSNDVSIYSIDAATGALTLIGTAGT